VGHVLDLVLRDIFFDDVEHPALRIEMSEERAELFERHGRASAPVTVLNEPDGRRWRRGSCFVRAGR